MTAECRSREWVDDAACASTDPDAFHPEFGDSAPYAKKVCAGCPVRDACLEHALVHESHWHGIWGGLSPADRRKLLKDRGEVAA